MNHLTTLLAAANEQIHNLQLCFPLDEIVVSEGSFTESNQL